MANYKKVTSKDVAKLAGVSQSTVSMVLNNSEAASFSEDTVQRVFGAAKELGYTIGRKRGKVPAPGGPGILLVICPTVTDQYYVSLVDTISVYAQSKGLLPLFFNTLLDSRSESRIVEITRHMPVSGVICLGTPALPDAIHQLAQQLPMVLIGDHQDNLQADFIGLDSVSLGVLLGRHLLGLEHRSVAYITPSLEPGQSTRRGILQGLQSVYQEAGLPRESVAVLNAEEEPIPSRGSHDPYAVGFRLAKQAAARPGVTAILGASDMVAYGILDSLTQLGFQVPQEYSVCGCDNLLFSNMRSIGLTTVEHFAAEKARDAVDILLRRIDEASGGAAPVKTHQVAYEPQLIIRTSTGPSRPESAR